MLNMTLKEVNDRVAKLLLNSNRIFDVNEFLKMFPVWRRPRAVMADGFSISIQASMYHYCLPQKNSADFYTAVELGFPSIKEDLIMDYIESPDDIPTDAVYGYVPVEVVNEMIKKHGGIVWLQTRRIEHG